MGTATMIEQAQPKVVKHRGTVVSYHMERGWGFIKFDAMGTDIFVNWRDCPPVPSCNNKHGLLKDQAVEFEIGQRQIMVNGKPEMRTVAVNVWPIGKKVLLDARTEEDEGPRTIEGVVPE